MTLVILAVLLFALTLPRQKKTRGSHGPRVSKGAKPKERPKREFHRSFCGGLGCVDCTGWVATKDDGSRRHAFSLSAWRRSMS